VRITRLTVSDVRTHRGTHEFDLAPGLTVICGPNEAGKSTLQRALELALTRRVTSNSNDLDGLRPWHGADDIRPEVALDFEYEDDDGVHAGRLEKSFRGAKGQVRLDIEGETITDPIRADERLVDLTGIPSEGFFRSTASVRHHEMAGIVRDEAALRDRLQASISGADRGTSRARRKLERALFDLNTKGEKNPGRLKHAEKTLADTEEQLAAGESALQRLERDRDSLALARERRSDAETALGERRALLERARVAERLQGERDAAKDRYERFRQAVDVFAEIERLEQTHPSPNPLPVLRQAVERLRVLDRRIAELTALLADEPDINFDVAPEVRWRPLSRMAIGLVALGLAVAGIAFAVDVTGIMGGLGTAPLMLGGAIAGIGLALAIVAFWLRRSDRVDQQLRDVQIARRLRGRSEMEQELKQAQADTTQQLGGLGLEDLASAEDLFAREDEHSGLIDQHRARLDGLVGKEPPETLPAQRDAAALDIEQKAAALEALGPIAKEPRARERLEVEVADAERSMESARDDEANARARVEQNPVDAEEVAALEESAASWRDQLAALQRRDRVYRTALTAIEDAERATMQTATRYLERRMVRDLQRVTGGRYRRVRIDDANLGMDVWAPERNDWVSVTELSQGTLDVVYLAARLGLVRLVTGDRRPPLILDDPFVTLDDARATRAVELLREIAADFQVIYLTTSHRYDAIADKVVELRGPTAVDLGAPEPAEVTADA
jgi:DNA repair exonuclease SbcCD ATPase subunit